MTQFLKGKGATSFGKTNRKASEALALFFD